VDGGNAFIELRDRLLREGLPHAQALQSFHWPPIPHFNWASDYFDRIAVGSDRPALRVVDDAGGDQVKSFAELARRSSQVANFLASQGIGAGDRVLIMLGNVVPLWEVMLATIKLGAVMIPATTLLQRADIEDRLARGRVRAVITDRALARHFDGLAGAPIRISVGGAVPGWSEFESSHGADTAFHARTPTPADALMLLYFTSGTTAKPKLVAHSQTSYPVGHLSTAYWIGLRSGDVHLNLSSPGWAKHAWSSFFAPWNAEATVLAYQFERFSAVALLDQLVRCGVTTFCAPPTVWRMLIQEDLGRWPVALREVVAAGEPLNPEVIGQVRAAWGLTIRDGFGQTETTAQIGNPPGQLLKPGSMGRPLPGYPVALVTADGSLGDEGEICLDLRQRPVGLMQGYLDDPDKTAEVMRDGYYHTGDVASRDADGYLTYVGRLDDVFKSSDYRISPFELESVLIEHELVAEAAVVPSPEPLRLAVPKAYVMLTAGAVADAATARSILEYVRGRVAPFKRIRRLEFADLPKTISGKIRRVELRLSEKDRSAAAPRRTYEFWEEDFPDLRRARGAKGDSNEVSNEDSNGDSDRPTHARPTGDRPSLSFVSGTSDQPLLYRTVDGVLKAALDKVPDRAALVVPFQSTRLTFAELDREVERVARGLVACGLNSGERIGIWAPNCVEWILTMFGAARAGLVLVNINPAYRPTELEFALRVAGCRALVFAPRFKSSDYAAMLQSLIPELATAPPGRLECAAFPDLRLLVQLGTEPLDGALSFDDLAASGYGLDAAALASIEEKLDADQVFNIQFTSGTTGTPKGATLTHFNIVNNGFFVGEGMRLTAEDSVCIPVPLYHCFGMVLGVLAAMTHGAASVLPGDGFEPLAVLETVQRERCTALHGVPTMFIAELEHPRFGEFDLSSLRTGIMAGSPCPITVMRRVVAEMHMPQVTICYGMTETSPVSFQSGPDDPLERRVGTVGRVHPHVQVKIIDGDGHVTPRGTAGELLTRGYGVMRGYWGDVERTRDVLDAGGWMHTGDLGVIDEQGYCNIVGRVKDMIIRGGENVSPREIEEFLYRHPAVLDVAVVGVPDAKYGEAVCACIRLREGMSTTEEEVREFCRGQIAHYKVPRYVRFVEGFPLTVSGKVQKYLIREQLCGELGLREEKHA
jgi:fatty-acyl-CoA synthase